MEASKASPTPFSPERGLVNNGAFVKKILSASFDKTVTNKDITYFNVPSAFDIEVSSFYNGFNYDSHGKATPRKNGVMYVWQFGILNWVTYGRTWTQFIALMNMLSDILGLNEKNRLVVYVHNLPYEFAFMRSRIKFDKVFLIEERKPVYAIWGGFEFRCSLKLSSKSLANVGADLVKYKEHKHLGDLDYQLIRFHSTPLTEAELGYIESDIRVLLAYIQEKIESDGSVAYIPLTNTGYVRKHCRRACFKHFKFYRGLMNCLTLDSEEYAQLKRAFAGGFTHASARYVAEGLEAPLRDVSSFDFTSSYPAVMLLEQFPMSKATVVTELTEEKFRQYLHSKCCLFDITFRYVTPKLDYDHPVSFSKLILPSDSEEKKRIRSAMTIDNGRVVQAEEMTLTMTEQDFFVFEKFYNYAEYNIHSMRIYEKGYLPKELYVAILDLYKKKTELKDVKGEEINYMILKNMLNAAYGMIVTDIVRDIIEYDAEQGFLPKRKPNLEEAIEKYNNSKNRFLFYPWGVWVTAYARRNLFSGIESVGYDYIYADTDSMKIFNKDKHMSYINAYNAMIKEKINRAAEHFGLGVELYSPKNKKGVEKTIGVWEYEGTYKRFKTLGAKRYLIETHDEEYILTTAGVNKKKARDYLVEYYEDPFDGFTKDLCIPAKYSGRLILTYVDEPCYGVAVDYLGNEVEYREETYIHMEPSDYNLTVSVEYNWFLMMLHGVTEDSW